VTNGWGVEAAIRGAAVASSADGCGAGVEGGAFGAAVGNGALVGSDVGTALGLGAGTAVGGALMLAATTLAGTLVGAAAAIGAGVTAICCWVGIGFGAAVLTGAGVGFGGAVGANFASSCNTRGCGGADRGCAAATAFGTTGACGTGIAARGTVTGAVFVGAACVTITIALPAVDSGAACSDDDVASENNR
jgi:hypothetical protein